MGVIKIKGMSVRKIIIRRNICFQLIPGIFLKIHTVRLREKWPEIWERTISVQLLPGIFLSWKKCLD
jgi:hypothetical protein